MPSPKKSSTKTSPKSPPQTEACDVTVLSARLTALAGEIVDTAAGLVKLYDTPEGKSWRGMTWDDNADQVMGILRQLVKKAQKVEADARDEEDASDDAEENFETGLARFEGVVVHVGPQ